MPCGNLLKLGQADGRQLSESVERLFQYDARNLLTSQSVPRDAAPLFDTTCDYDRAGT